MTKKFGVVPWMLLRLVCHPERFCPLKIGVKPSGTLTGNCANSRPANRSPPDRIFCVGAGRPIGSSLSVPGGGGTGSNATGDQSGGDVRAARGERTRGQ